MTIDLGKSGEIEPSYHVRKVTFTCEDIPLFLEVLNRICSCHHCSIVLLDATRVAGLAHVCSALDHAVRSWKTSTNIARSFQMETLLFAAGSRQCTEAARVGIHKGFNMAYCVCYPNSKGVWDDLGLYMTESFEDWEEINVDKERFLMEQFGITAAELECVGPGHIRDLVKERVALLWITR
jgi:KEOPS complex subunit Cgi121